MAYNDDAVLARLSALNESQDSIASSAQWIMFHRRHANRTVQLWLQRLRDLGSTKRLSLIYLANEVTQQSKARQKDDFVTAFSPIIAEAMALAYKGAPTEIQARLKRVNDVWKDRAIFEAPIQAAIDSRIEEVEKARGTAKASFGGSTLSTSSVPSDLSHLVTAYQNVSKLTLPTKTSISSANQDFEKVTDSAAPVPSAPVYAARLNGLLKSLATAEGAVSECVKARRELVGALEELLNTNKAALATEEKQLHDLSTRKTETDDKRREVELAIMRGLGSSDNSRSAAEGSSTSPAPEPERPEMEALTPPSMDDEPPISPTVQPALRSPISNQGASLQQPVAPGIEMLSNLASQFQAIPIATNGSNKRRRLDAGDDFPDLGGDDDIDADVAEMLRKDSSGS